jgi:malate dehydrogenase (oxaloacetate-decarboxylating)
VTELRLVAIAVAQVVARQAQDDGVADPCDAATLEARIAARVWEPDIGPIERLAEFSVWAAPMPTPPRPG